MGRDCRFCKRVRRLVGLGDATPAQRTGTNPPPACPKPEPPPNPPPKARRSQPTQD